MPEGKDGKPPYYEFSNFHKQVLLPITVYFDIESILRKIHSCSPDDKDSCTERYQKHIPSGYNIVFKSTDDKVFKPELHQYTMKSDDDYVMGKFIKDIESSVKRFWNTIDFNKDFDGITLEEYYTATKCWVCKGKLNGDKVKDHDHFTGRYRGPTHNKCNLLLRMPPVITMFSHNLSGYDAYSSQHSWRDYLYPA